MTGIQPIDLYARRISDEKRHSVLDGASAGTEKRYQVLHRDFADPDALRRLAAAIKDHTLQHLGDYLERAEQAMTARGVKVHYAATGDDAKREILSILRGHGVERLTKSKTMAAEEIHLNPFLIENGIECLESDLGEFIVQLDGDEPSHIVKPIIHKNRREIARTFQREGVQYEWDLLQVDSAGSLVPVPLISARTDNPIVLAAIQRRLRNEAHFVTATGVSVVVSGTTALIAAATPPPPRRRR